MILYLTLTIALSLYAPMPLYASAVIVGMGYGLFTMDDGKPQSDDGELQSLNPRLMEMYRRQR